MSKLLVGETCENITQVNAGWHKCEYTTHLVKVWLVTNVTREQMWGWPAREGCLAQPHQAAAAAAAAAKKLQEFQIFLAKQQQRHQSAQQRSSQEKRCTRFTSNAQIVFAFLCFDSLVLNPLLLLSPLWGWSISRQIGQEINQSNLIIIDWHRYPPEKLAYKE